jgi:hypothetical protein
VIAAAPLLVRITVQPTGATLISATKGEESVAMRAIYYSNAGQEVQGLVDGYYQAEHPGVAEPAQPEAEPEQTEAEWLEAEPAEAEAVN